MLKLRNTLSGGKEEFRPVHGNMVLLYTCGPSVYNFSHIGNFRTFAFWDVLKRYLRYRGFGVRHVMNITDIEDKAIKMARKSGRGLFEFERPVVARFFWDMGALNIQKPDVIAPVSKNISAIISLIGKLVSKGHAYVAEDGVYFRLKSFPAYGKLGGIKKSGIKNGRNRFDDYDRRYVRDFSLWKFTGVKPNWNSPWGRGRPGWHIECSAIAMKYLGERIDIHCGGTDNIFPHHDNEIAQSEAASGKRPFAKYWLHARHLTLNKRKMSKRTENVIYVRDLLSEGHGADCLRFILLSRGYRGKLDLNPQTIARGDAFHERYSECLEKLGRIGRGKRTGKFGSKAVKNLVLQHKKRFEHAMDSDLDTRRAIAALLALAEKLSALCPRMGGAEARFAKREIGRMGQVLGFGGI